MPDEVSSTTLAVARAVEILGAIGVFAGTVVTILGWVVGRGGLQPGGTMEVMFVSAGLFVAILCAALWGSAYVTRRVISRHGDS